MKKLLLSVVSALAMIGAAHGEPILIKDGRVITNASAGVLENGDVLIDGGRVIGVGAEIAAPRNARVIDAKGKWVTPGIFAAMSEVGLNEISGSGAPNDASVDSETINAAASAADAFNPGVSAVAVTRMEGVTRAAIAPSAAHTLFSGQGALVALNGAPDSVFRPRAFMMLEWGERGARRAGGSRAATTPMFNAALRDAREYPARFKSGQGGAVLSEIDAEALQPFARGQGLFVAHVESANDMRTLINLQRANPGLRFVIHGGAEAWRVARELARARIPVILDPFNNLPDSFERLAARADNAAILQRAGVTIAFAPKPGDVDAHQTRLAPQLAGNAVANGLSWEAAFAAITKNPAAIFGANDLGTLERGKIADVVVWDGDPLDVTSAPTAVYIAGAEMPLESRQTKLRDRYRPR
jgi:imidazolonepropionase-like amidohydrolase